MVKIKIIFEIIFYLAVIVFCFLIVNIPADSRGFTSPYSDYDENNQRIEIKHLELLNHAKDWQAKYLWKIDRESRKALREVNNLKKKVKFDPNGYNGDLFVILGSIDSEIDFISSHEIRLNLKSEEWEFKNMLAYWKSFRTHPESPLNELKNYLSQTQAQKE